MACHGQSGWVGLCSRTEHERARERREQEIGIDDEDFDLAGGPSCTRGGAVRVGSGGSSTSRLERGTSILAACWQVWQRLVRSSSETPVFPQTGRE